jgi:anthranilate synthase component 1
VTSSATTTTRAQFDSALTETWTIIPVIRQVFADGETPVAIYQKLAANKPGSFLLESAEQGGIWSRFSFVGVESFGVLTEANGVAQWNSESMSVAEVCGGVLPDGTLEALRQIYARWTAKPVTGLPALASGLVGYLGWDVVRQLENLPHAPEVDVNTAEIALSFARDLIVLDHKWGTVLLVTNVLVPENGDSASAWVDAQSRLDALQGSLATSAPVFLADIDLTSRPDVNFRMEKQEFLDAVSTSKDHIVAGDVFQVVISQRFDVDNHASATDVYRVLRSLNPSPYMYLLCHTDSSGELMHVVGSSPEALVKVQSGRVFTKPIAGSRPRGETPELDAALADELLLDPKERAEHLMLVDLARNDLLRVCQPGSVEVAEFMKIERFSHIMHIVSSVEGALAENANAIDVFAATFPAGTLSGAPKPRALEIIDALEPSARGVYGGVVGYFAFSGDADLAIAIRTSVLVGNRAYVQAGAGLVADSDPETEYQETVNKSAAPLRAVAIANQLRHFSQ